jgi:hypothetical protein
MKIGLVIYYRRCIQPSCKGRVQMSQKEQAALHKRLEQRKANAMTGTDHRYTPRGPDKRTVKEWTPHTSPKEKTTIKLIPTLAAVAVVAAGAIAAGIIFSGMNDSGSSDGVTVNYSDQCPTSADEMCSCPSAIEVTTSLYAICKCPPGTIDNGRLEDYYHETLGWVKVRYCTCADCD